MIDPSPRIVAVVHRRAGKSTALLWRGMLRAGLLSQVRANPRVVHILPYSVMWQRTGLWDAAVQVSDELHGSVRRGELQIRLPGGGVWQAGGADNPDSWRGGYADEVIVDEYDDTPPGLTALVIEPMLAGRGAGADEGVLIRSGTPKGRGLLRKAYDDAGHKRGHARYLLDWKATGALPMDAIERLRDEMSEEEFAQELECSFETPNSGSYYGKLLNEAERGGRITRVPHDPMLLCWSAWDLGVDDATAIWIAQVTRAGEWRLIDYIENSGVGLDWYAQELDRRRYSWGGHILPHDVRVQELGTGRSREETLRGLGLNSLRVLPAAKVADGINAVRMVLPKCWFDAERCKRGIEALRHYRREWSESNQTWRGNPVHDWASHGADGFRYLATGYREASPRPLLDKPPAQFFEDRMAEYRARGDVSWMAG